MLHKNATTLSLKWRDIYTHTHTHARTHERPRATSVVVVEQAEGQTHTHTQRERERDLKSAEKTRGTSLLFFLSGKFCALLDFFSSRLKFLGVER